MNSLFHRIYFFIKVGWLWGTQRKVAPHNIADDYNHLAATYDAFFSGFMIPHTRQLVQKILLPPEPLRALDLACGTGSLTRVLGERLSSASALTGVDLSERMIAQAKTNVLRPVTFFQEDILRFVSKTPDEEYDVVTCGWAVGYVRPQLLIKEIHRVLAPGGMVGIIENRQSTLSEIRETGIKVMMRYPQHVRRLMDLTFRLPENKARLRSWFRKVGLKTRELWDGQIEFRFKSGADVLNWVLHTGASAGFDQMMDPDTKQVCDDAFIEIIEKDYMRDGQIQTAHRFVAGIAQK